MIIACDCRKALIKQPTGVDDYWSAILPEVVKNQSDDQFILFYNTTRAILPDWLQELASFNNVKFINFGWPNKLLHFMLMIFGWPRFEHWIKNADIYWLPNIHYLPKMSKPYVLTVHDLSFLIMPEVFSWSRRFWHWRIKAQAQIKNASGLIAVSENTRQDVIKQLQVFEDQVARIYSAPINYLKNNGPTSPQLVNFCQQNKYFLFVATLEPRKNISEIFQALDLISEPEFKVVIVGKSGWKINDLKKNFQKTKNQDSFLFLDYVSPADLVILYQNCLGLIWPSLYEGFGFPPLVAQEFNKPVICANNSSLPELIANQGLLINATNANELAWAIKQIFANYTQLPQATTESLIPKSWQECATNSYNFINKTYVKNRI